MVFYPDLGHVGIVAGYDGDGKCADCALLLEWCCGNGTSWVYVGWQTGGVLEYKSKNIYSIKILRITTAKLFEFYNSLR